MTKITIGARSSKLSLAYVAKVKELLLKNNNDLKEENINFKAIKTSGDLNLNKNICSELFNFFLEKRSFNFSYLTNLYIFLFLSEKVSLKDFSFL